MDTIDLYSASCLPLPVLPFDSPRKALRVVCTDFDNTYMSFHDRDKPRSGIPDFERFIERTGDRLGIVLGWISGSSLTALLRKSERHVGRMPHFIASSLGTEFYWVTPDGIWRSVEWEGRIAESGYTIAGLRKAVRILKQRGIKLEPQHPDYQGKIMECHFYYPGADPDSEQELIDSVCAANSIKAVMSSCNPLVGDPAGYYDIQFMPLTCGKREAAAFAAEKVGVGQGDVWAFGDSMNDMEMLGWACNSFLVENADPEAKRYFGNVLQGEYCNGIHQRLAELL